MEKPSQNRPWWQPGLTVFAQVTGWIAAPIILSLYLGKYLDGRYDSYPWFFLGTTGLALVISCVGIVRIAKQYMSQIENETKTTKLDATTRNSNNRGNRQRD